MERCQGNDFTAALCLHLLLVVGDFRSGFEAVHDGHLQIHDDYPVRSVLTQWVSTLTIHEIVFVHFKCLQPALGFIDLYKVLVFVIMIILKAFAPDLKQIFRVNFKFAHNVLYRLI